MAGSNIVFRFKCAGQLDDLFEVVSFEGTEGLSRLYEFRLELASKDPDIDTGSILKNSAVLEMERDGGVVEIHGIVAEFEQRDAGLEWIEYRAVLVPGLFALGMNTQCQIYLDKDVPTIVRELLTEDGFNENEDFILALSRTDYRAQEYTVQYQESDLNFISRLLEHEGIYFFFRQGEHKEILVLTDSIEAHTPIAGDSVILYRDARSVNPGGEAVSSLTLRQQLRPANVTLKDYNWRSPSVEMLAQAPAAPSGRGTHMEYGDHFKDPTEGLILARIRAQELTCQELVYSGRSAVRAFHAGDRFTLAEHFRGASNIEYLLTEVRHLGEQIGIIGSAAGGAADQPSYRNEFKAIPAAVQFRPPRVTPKPRIYGTLNAVVDSSTSGEYADVDELGRYKVRLPFDLSDNGGGKASRFVRMAQPYAGDEYGMHFPLHKGTEVLLTHVDGDPDRPIISAAVPNAATQSPVTAGNPSQSVMKTAGDNHITMEDTTGSRFVELSTPEAANGSSFVRLGAPGAVLDNMIPPANPESGAPDDRITVMLSPKVIAVPTYGSYVLNPTVLYATDPSVTWSLDNPEYGTISEDGVFVGPTEIPEDGVFVMVRATSNENPAKYDEVKIVLYTPFVEPTRIYLAPLTARMEIGESLKLSAIPVGVTQDMSGVGWRVMEGDAHGTVSLTGLYTPPATLPTPATATIRAYLLGDPSQYVESVISLFPAGSRNPSVASVAVTPRNVRLGPGESQLFSATVTGDANTAVTWECDPPGTIDASGYFTAPASFDSPSLVSIRARSVAQPNRSGETQAVLYRPPTPPITIIVDPERPTTAMDLTQQFTALVVGNPNTAVRWEASSGTISSAGLFTPGATGSVTIKAISLADESYMGATEVTVLAAGALAMVNVTPGTADVVVNATQLFTATVTGASNTAVTWSAVGGGTISATGLYTAPATSPGSPVTIKATSVANGAIVGEATVTVLSVAPVATFQWEKIVTKVTELKNANELREGDIAIAVNNSVSLTRKDSVAETQEDSYSSVIGNSYAYVKGNTESMTIGDADATIEGHSSSAIHSGSFSITWPESIGVTLGLSASVVLGMAIQATAGAFINFTMLGFWANVIIGGLTIDAYLGGKITVNKGRNWVFYDVDDFEVIDKTTTTSARNEVNLECGPMFPGPAAPPPGSPPLSPSAASKAMFMSKVVDAFTPKVAPPATCTVNMKPDTIDFETVKPVGVMTFKVAATPVVTIKNTQVEIATTATVDIKAATKIELTSATVNIAGALMINGVAPPPPVPAPPPPPPPPPLPPLPPPPPAP